MPFYNREKDISRLKAVLSGEPNLVYFVYGPINSGKTALLNRVFEELDDSYRVFYINFRGVEGGYKKFTRTLFELGDERLWRTLRERASFVAAAVEYVERVAKKLNTSIELPSEVIRSLQVGDADPEKLDVFKYLEKVIRRLREGGKRPVLVFDELQVIKDELNATGMPLLARLFNFLVRMTKETHLCHCLCATSDCLFIEQIYASARLEGRADYILVDDLDKDEAYVLYEHFGFEDKELVWDYIGGKVGDMVRLYEKRKRESSEEEALGSMLREEADRLDDLLERVEEGEFEVRVDEVKQALELFKEEYEVPKRAIPRYIRGFLVSENILFYNPLTGTVKPQGRLIWHAIREVV